MPAVGRPQRGRGREQAHDGIEFQIGPRSEVSQQQHCRGHERQAEPDAEAKGEHGHQQEAARLRQAGHADGGADQGDDEQRLGRHLLADQAPDAGNRRADQRLDREHRRRRGRADATLDQVLDGEAVRGRVDQQVGRVGADDDVVLRCHQRRPDGRMAKFAEHLDRAGLLRRRVLVGRFLDLAGTGQNGEEPREHSRHGEHHPIAAPAVGRRIDKHIDLGPRDTAQGADGEIGSQDGRPALEEAGQHMRARNGADQGEGQADQCRANQVRHHRVRCRLKAEARHEDRRADGDRRPHADRADEHGRHDAREAAGDAKVGEADAGLLPVPVQLPHHRRQDDADRRKGAGRHHEEDQGQGREGRPSVADHRAPSAHGSGGRLHSGFGCGQGHHAAAQH